MREQYARHDVLLKLSRVEGLPLPLVEACHVGVPCVVTPFTGHDEVIRHGENGLVVGFDDAGRHGGGARPLGARPLAPAAAVGGRDREHERMAVGRRRRGRVRNRAHGGGGSAGAGRGAGRSRGVEALAGGGGGRPNRARRGRGQIPGARGADPVA